MVSKVIGTAIVLVIFLLTVATMWSIETFVMWSLWRWFAIPMGAPALSVLHIGGLNVLVTIFTWRFVKIEKEDGGKCAKAWAWMVSGCYGFGWVLSHFI